MALPLISNGNRYDKFIQYFEKEYLKSASAMVGKVVGHNKETSNVNEANTNGLLPEAEDVSI